MPRILVVDDEEQIRRVLKLTLERAGYEVDTAADGNEAVAVFDPARHDLVITDIVMPFVSGVGVVSALKQKRPGIPVIAITGFGKEPETAAMEKNADLVLSKPVKISFLTEQIARLIGLPREEGAP